MNIDTIRLQEQTAMLTQAIKTDNIFHNKANYELLVSVITDHNHFYYIDNNPIISDHDYDLLFKTLQRFEELNPKLIRDDSPTQSLQNQYEIQSWFKKTDHASPILSLENSYNIKDIQDRYDSISNLLEKEEIDTTQLRFSIEPKYDGLSIVLTYKNWKLFKAVTRGDGYTGDDVTANVHTIKNLPTTITTDKTVIIRGEIMMTKSARKKLNLEREESGDLPFANTRNAAAGSLKLLDTNLVAQRKLICYVYDVLHGPNQILDEFETLNKLTNKSNGYTFDELLDFIRTSDIKNKLLKQEVDFDGLVIKLLGEDIRHKVWSTSHHPRRAVAYKFPAQQAATQIVDITRQVGRTRILTPVAHLQSVKLSWASISRVSLHNRDFITNKDIQIYDRVWLQRSGEVIPYIVSVIKDRRDGTQKKLEQNTIYCPACNTQAKVALHQVGTKTKPLTTTQLLCPNPDCPGVLKEQLHHFVWKNALNINTLWEATIDLLVDQWLLQSLDDLYSLTHPEQQFIMKRLPWIGDKKIITLIEELDESRTKPLWRFLNAFGIPGIGIKIAKDIEKALVSRPENPKKLSEMMSIITTQQFLDNIHGIGSTIINDLVQRSKNNTDLISKLEHYQITPSLPHLPASSSNTPSIAITWSFSLTRSELTYYIQEAGFQFSPSLTKKTTYLLVGTNPWNKLNKVWKNTKIISKLEEIYSLLNISTPLFEEKEKAPNWNKNMQSLF